MERLPQFAPGWSAPDPRAMALLRQPPGLAHFRSVESSPDPDKATAQTIRIMCRHIADGARDSLLQSVARDAVSRFRGGPAPSSNAAVNAACSDWWYAKHYLRFVHHEHLIRSWLAESDQLQLLIPPDALLRLADPQGDCAVYSMLLCAMLKAQGIRYELVTVATEPGEPRVFNHVYCRAVIDGVRLPLDASHGKMPGWQVPNSDVFRKQVWDEQGNPIADEDTRFNGLHGYRRGRSGLRGWRRRGLGATVCYDSDAGPVCYDDGTGADVSTPTFGPTIQQLTTRTPSPVITTAPISQVGASYATPSAPAAPALTPSPWDAFAANMANAWTKIAGNVIAPQTTLVRGPGGQLYYSTPAGSSTSAAGSLLGATTGLSGTTMLILAAAVVGAIALSGKR